MDIGPNYQKWLSYTEGLSSPNNFISWSWLSMISAALQRRVWLSANDERCFANMYVILVAEPGIGKGIVIKRVKACLKHWKKEDWKPKMHEGATSDEKVIADTLAESDLKKAQEAQTQGKGGKADLQKPLLFYVAPDAITYEALVCSVAESFTRINYREDIGGGVMKSKIYGHSSACFLLEELSSLMRQRTNDTINYLLGLYDCPDDYEYKTLTRGNDIVRRGCLNILAGTTPAFLQSTFNQRLTDEGLSSRTFFIFAAKNRKNQFFRPTLTEEQEEAKKTILTHLMKLSQLYGRVSVDSDTNLFLEQWFDNSEKNKHMRANNSPAMKAYYGRKNVHVMKVAMALHFGESTEMFIPKETFKKAIELLEKEERSMHMAITLEAQNPEMRAAKKIVSLLESGKKNIVEITCEAYNFVDNKGMMNALSFLEDTDQVRKFQIENEKSGKIELWWEIK